MPPPPGPSEPVDTLAMIGPHLEVARADKAVTLSGTLMQACFYKTTATPTVANQYAMHFAKSAGGFSLRLDQLMAGDDEVFIELPLTSVSPSSIVVDPTSIAFVDAENTSRGHDGSDGFSIPIGTVKRR